MMKRKTTAILGIAALIQAQAAQAQTACVDPADLDDAIIYAMPLAFDAAQNACASEFSSDGFMLTGGAAFVEGFRERQDAAWPGAFRMLKVFMSKSQEGGGGEDIELLLSTIPADSLRPFVDGIVTQKIAAELEPDTCGKVERAMALISPLPVENVSGLVTFIAEQADLKDPEICKPSSGPASE